MRLVRWTPAAADDLETIVGHIREDKPEAAREVAEKIFQTLRKLPAFPGLGRPGRKPGTRELSLPPYVIVYRAAENSIEILRIWHGAQHRP